MEPNSLEMRQRSDDWLEPQRYLLVQQHIFAGSVHITSHHIRQPELEFVFCAHQEDSKELSKEMKNAYNRLDRSTYSNPTEVLSTVVHLEWDLNFDTKIISGSATHSMVVIAHQGAEVAKFDSSGIKVTHVEVNSNPVQFTFGESSKALGNCLVVPIPAHLRSVGDEFDVKFSYSTSPNASAAQWLSAKATRSGNYPFLFTQCQAIHARSLFPCQDSPGVKTTYTAVVKAPTWARVLMSALDETPEGTPKGETHWRQPVPTPAYLVALAAGELDCKVISPRVKVWAEPSAVEAAAFEFSQTEEFLVAAESLTCPYAWGRYDILCLPPSFPYGGMENPCLTFATPTLLAGDKSLADVIAHEIAHSWTGNLVTNCTWEHFWLNEGWTVWLERKIMSRVKGDRDVLKLSAEIGWKALKDSVALMGNGKFTELVWPLQVEDPDDAFSSVPYEKGFNFLFQLESIVGTGPFEEFAKNYINAHKFGCVSSGEFKDYFLGFFGGNPEVAALDWDQFFYSTGMPKFVPDFSNKLSAHALTLADQWIEWFRENAKGAWKGGPSEMEGWTSQQKCVFLERLLTFSKESGPFSIEILESLDLAYGLTASGNSEIKFRWQTLCLESDAPWIVPHVIAFVQSQGRMKFVRPLYRALHQSAVGTGIARSTFIENNESYHPIARKMIAQDLSVNLESIHSTPAVAQPVSTSSSSKPIKMLQSDPAPPAVSSDWVPWVLAAGAIGLAAFAIAKKR